MKNNKSVLAMIPARQGSKGLINKNLHPFAGLPLIAHSILLAKMCPKISHLAVSTDSEEIARVARSYGADVPFLRPASLAQDDTPTWPVIRHVLEKLEIEEKVRYEYVVLLEPTTPCRLPEIVSGGLARLQENSLADGVIGVSRPDFNPIWCCVVERDGWMANLIEEGQLYTRRQDVPKVFRINGSLYIWRADFVRKQKDNWQKSGKYLMYEVPDFLSISIDTLEQLQRAELLVKTGLVKLPWLKDKNLVLKAS